MDCGVFRLVVHDPQTLGIYISTGRNVTVIAEKYWSKGKSFLLPSAEELIPISFSAPGIPSRSEPRNTMWPDG